MQEPGFLSIAVTGGPCAGKTATMGPLRERLRAKGVPAVFVAEAATDLILAGSTPEACGSMLEFQTLVIALQLEREAAARASAADLAGRAVIVHDRGICDSRAYLDESDYALALRRNGLTPEAALARYDFVLHLQTAAKAGEGLYVRKSNAARLEDARGAVNADDRTLAAWAGHPNIAVIGAEESFARKEARVVEEVMRQIAANSWMCQSSDE